MNHLGTKINIFLLIEEDIIVRIHTGGTGAKHPAMGSLKYYEFPILKGTILFIPGAHKEMIPKGSKIIGRYKKTKDETVNICWDMIRQSDFISNYYQGLKAIDFIDYINESITSKNAKVDAYYTNDDERIGRYKILTEKELISLNNDLKFNFFL